MPGQLFTQYFLTDGIKETDDWNSSATQPEAFTDFKDTIRQLLDALSQSVEPNEATTEQDLIRPILESLGWTDYLPQQGTSGGEDIPDHLLFTDAESKATAAARPNSNDRYLDALLVQESKRFGLPLDKRDSNDNEKTGTPHGQILRYLATADSVTDGRIRWGMLTNGAVWRLYDFRARPRASGYFEVNLTELIQSGDDDGLRTFLLLFRRESYTLHEGATTTFLEAALAEGRRYEERVARDLSEVVFDEVFPALVNGFTNESSGDLEEIRNTALIFLYRLLFVLYAEDRGLLPVNDERYDDYGLRKRVRDDIADRMSQGDTFSGTAANYYNRLVELFRVIDQGDPSIGLPPYNGGLFSQDTAPMLGNVRLPDAVIAPVIHAMSHREIDGTRHFVNYRDMSVQQLGSIYERLLERELAQDDEGGVAIRPNSYARRDTGSFYTPQELVDLIVEHTLKPLVEERLKAFEEKSDALRRDRRPRHAREAALSRHDPAEAVLELKVLDPAMGSGHFLVTAVDFLSDYVAELIEYVPTVPTWLDGAYESPLVGRIDRIRGEIIQRAGESNWVIDESQLTDQAIIRRMVLKRCIYGVDKNRLTVELAKVSLWLHSFTVGAPLSFLDHHLRWGDSLIGFRVGDVVSELERLGTMFTSTVIAAAEAATSSMKMIEEMSDSDVSEVRESASLFDQVEETTADLRGLLDFLTSRRWLTAGLKQKELVSVERPLADTLGWYPGSQYELLSRGPDQLDVSVPPKSEGYWSQFNEFWHQARDLADRERFLHWEAAFPGVWKYWANVRSDGGFDAIIGNPPWDRIKLQEVEWFATRDPDLARAPTAAARRREIERLRAAGDPLASAFDEAKERADSLGRLIRASGEYPLLGGGDINLYSLFVERSMNLVKPGGLVGLLTPSGIYADKTSAAFFKSFSTNGRISGLYDFENRRLGTSQPPFFPDVDSRFKFCAFIFGGDDRRFDQTECAFFLHDAETIDDPDRCFPLAPDDFARVNPNTGTAPVFRNRRDAEITRGIYERHPVLVDRSGDEECRTWPVKYVRMFDMTNDSNLFRTSAQLEEDGFYPVQGNRWKRGNNVYLPLYQGRMIWQFDHRASSVRVNPGNLHNPYLSDVVTEAQHAETDFLPQTQYWVPSNIVAEILPTNCGFSLGFRDIARSTDARTVIASIVPLAGFGNKVPLLVEQTSQCNNWPMCQIALVSNLNAICLDYIARQKIHGTSLNWYIVEQLPFIARTRYDLPLGVNTAGDIVLDHVLRLTYTARDMTPFARRLGYDGPPFIWNKEERLHLRARLDALYFLLYGLSRDDAGYVLDTFNIVRRDDEQTYGFYRTKDLILAYMNALEAGDTETVVAV
ncbi:MAG: restriction endonuclease [Gemmatimonadetes bacterium]|nr:restriction endonuclease [Gemmatimonadota bacterium]